MLQELMMSFRFRAMMMLLIRRCLCREMARARQDGDIFIDARFHADFATRAPAPLLIC